MSAADQREDSGERIAYLAERHRSGALDANDLAELERLCADPANAREFVETLADMHEFHALASSPRQDQAFVDAVVERSRPRRGRASAVFVKNVVEAARRDKGRPVSLRKRRIKESGFPAWIPGLAACLAAAVVLYFVFHGTAPQEVAHQPEAPKEAPAPQLPAVQDVPIAKITKLSAVANVRRRGSIHPATAGGELLADDMIESHDASVEFAYVGENTTVTLSPGSELKLGMSGAAKRPQLISGSLDASVAHQREPMLLSTPHAQAQVLGTELTFAVEGDETLLQVHEGKVQLKRPADGKSVDVSGGNAGTVSSDLAVAPTVKPLNLQRPWRERDVGATGAVKFDGSAQQHDANFTLHASGTDLWEKDDAFHFVYQPVSGDFELIAKVVKIENVKDWGLAGIMARASLAPDALNATMMITTQEKAKLRRRVKPGATTESTGPSAGSTALPRWLKLKRAGEVFSGYISDDGEKWTRVDKVNVPLPQTVYVGLVALDHNNAALCSAFFEGVMLTRK